MIRQHMHTRSYIHTHTYEYHTISCEGPMPAEQRLELERYGWQLFSVLGPESADDRRFAYHWRRRLESHRLRVRRAPGERGRT
jgi:hypothetical protein